MTGREFGKAIVILVVAAMVIFIVAMILFGGKTA